MAHPEYSYLRIFSKFGCAIVRREIKEHNTNARKRKKHLGSPTNTLEPSHRKNKIFAIAVLMIMSFMTFLPSAHAWDPIEDLTGKPLHRHHKDFQGSLDKLWHNPVDYTTNRAGEIVEDICSIPARTYTGVVRHRGNGLKPLPRWFVAKAQRFYNVDLSRVRYSEGADLYGFASGVTDKFNIYIERDINWNSYRDQYLMLHELEHVVQYANKGNGRSGMSCEYVRKAIGAGLRHDNIEMERAADNKASFVLNNWNNVQFQGYRGQGIGYSTYRRSQARLPYPQQPKVQLANVCRNGVYWQIVPPGPVGRPCFFHIRTPGGPRTINGALSFR